MPLVQRRKTALIIFALIGAALLGLLLYLNRKPIRAWAFRGPEYNAAFATVGGLRPGDEVRYGGLPAGRVKAMGIDPGDPSHIVVRFGVEEDIPMRADVRASVVDVTNPVTRYLSLSPGSRSARPLPPGSTVPSEVGPTPEQTLAHATRVLQRTDTLLQAAEQLMQSDFFANIDRTTRRLDRMTAAVTRSAERWAPDVERAAGRLDEVMTRTDHLLAVMDSTAPELRTAVGELAPLLQDTRLLLADLRQGAAQGGGLAGLMQDLTVAGDHLARVSSRLDRDPAALLRARRPPPKSAGPQLRD
ncbi:MAG TPA: MlaD family protein [Gemmatimonadales bacterium]|nr:MlaD family protein [Gemmatimonadales bacterium]